MPVAHIPMSDTTIAVTSTISALFTAGICIGLDMKPIIGIGLGVGVGILLYSTGIVPIGALVVLGISLLGSFFSKDRNS